MPILSERAKAYLYLTLAVLIWGIATPVIRATVSYIPPFTFLMLRFWIALIFALPMTIIFLRRYKLNYTRFKHIGIYTILAYILALSFYFTGLEKTSAVEGSLISSIAPLMAAVAGFFILKEIITRKEIEGTLIAFLGTLLIIFEPLITGNGGGIDHGRIGFLGNILFFGGVLADVLSIIYAKKFISDDKIINPILLISLSFVFAAIAFTPLGMMEQVSHYRSEFKAVSSDLLCKASNVDRSIYSESYDCDETGCFANNAKNYDCLFPVQKPAFISYFAGNLNGYMNSRALWGLLYMSILSGIAGYILYIKGLQYVEASESTLFYYLQPVFGIPVAMAYLGETITWVFVVGAILAVAGIYRAEKRG